jgi:hypothetical protein
MTSDEALMKLIETHNKIYLLTRCEETENGWRVKKPRHGWDTVDIKKHENGISYLVTINGDSTITVFNLFRELSGNAKDNTI